MPVYEYTARDTEGQLISETIAYRDEPSLRSYLRKNELYVLEVAEKRRSLQIPGLRRGVGLKDWVITTRQLRTMIKAGMPLVTGLEALADQASNPRLAQMLTEVARTVAHGATLADTLAQYPRLVPPILITLVRSGEVGGRLPEALHEASRQFELQMETRQKLISASIYPAFTLLATFGTLTAMMLWIVPVFAQIYSELHAPLPAITLLLIAISNAMVNYSWIFALCLVVVLVALFRYYRTPEGKLRIDGLKLKLPLFGGLYRKAASAGLTGSLAGLLDSGLPLLQALQAAADVSGNAVIGQAVHGTAANITLGRRFSDELERTGYFPIMVVRMVAIAEEVGTLPDVLREITLAYNEEVEYTIKRIVSLVEPMMVIVVGGIVGFMLVALYYPIFMLGQVFLNGA
jgi:type IV pilus assembly protein PilC